MVCIFCYITLNENSPLTPQNVIQGVYPVKPVVREDIGFEPLSIMGNEGVGTVEGFEEDGEVEKVLKVGDRGVDNFRNLMLGRAQ